MKALEVTVSLDFPLGPSMACGHTVLMRLVASAYAVAQKAGMIVRRVIAEGDLGIVEKVLTVSSHLLFHHLCVCSLTFS